MTKRDIYKEITDKIISILDRVNPDDYEAPFAGLAAQGLPMNPVTDHRYQGINIPSLWFDQQTREFSSNHWATFKQWKTNGAQVRKGEKGSPIILYKTLTKTDEDENGTETETAIPMLKIYTVFNADQVDGYDHGGNAKEDDADLVERIAAADRFCTATGARIEHGSEGAYYMPKTDSIHLPDTKKFINTKTATATENYYSTLFHELTHWTGAPKRLDRDRELYSGDQKKYAFEELIAELGAAFLCASLRITQAPRDDHAQYIKSWLQALKGDKKFVFKAAAQAAKANDYLNNFQTTQ